MSFFALFRPTFMSRPEGAAPGQWAPERRRHVARWWLRALAATLAAVLLLWGVLWLAVPPLLKSQAEQRLSTLLERTVTIGAVQFAPWSLQLTLRDFAIAGAGAADPPLLHVDRIHADADWRSLFRLAPVIEALELDAPQIHLARTAAGHHDIDDIIERLAPAPSAQTEPRPPARFALYNVQVRDGALSFDDRPVARRHELTGLLLTLPFLSTLPSQLAVAVEPRLAFTFDGAAFDTGAQSRPFSRDRETAMTLHMGEFDLAIAKPYLPPDLPVELQRGRAQADLSLHFTVGDDNSPSVSLRGGIKVTDLALADRRGAPLAAWRELNAELDDVQPLRRKAALGTVRFDGLDVALARDAQGRINVMQLASPGAAASPGAPADNDAAAVPPWQVSMQSFELAGARMRLDDALTPRAAALSIDAIDAAIGPITWPVTQPAKLSLKAQLQQAGQDAAAAKLELLGSATQTRADASLRLQEVDLAVWAPYLAPYFKPRVEGRAALDAKLAWAADPPALALNLASASVDALRIIDAQQRRRGKEKRPGDAVAWKRLEVADLQLDVPGHKLSIAQIALDDPQFVVERAQDGAINVAKWMGPATGASAGAAAAPRPGAEAIATAATSASWQVELAQISVDGGQVSWRDEAAPGSAADDPVQLEVHALRATVSGLSWPVATAQAQVQLSAQVADPAAVREQRRVRGGSIDWKGRVVAAPLALRGALRIERFPVHALDRYASGSVNASMQRGQLQWRGDVAMRERPGGIEANVAGDLLLADLHVFGKDPATRVVSQEELIGWQALSVRGLEVALTPQARPCIEVGEAVLSDFYSRLVLDEEGRFNLRDVARQGAPPTPPGGFAVGRQIAPTPVEPASAVAAAPRAEPAAAAASEPAPAASVPRAKLPIDLNVGGVQLVNGRVDYTDRLIRPNFSAALSELNGRVGAFRSDSPEMATLELHGRIAGTGLLDVQGSLNPLADPLALDVEAKASELELAPLSPYAGKYAGYAIERGKLSMDLHYNVQPDGRLEARNHVVLNQLTFGDRIESPSATKLPVRLAVALLSDRHGVIDINLPISGSISDPQFSVGGIIWQVIVNLIVKVVTSPLALFSGGGGPDLSVVDFRPGTPLMADDASAALDKVAKALEERPTLQMTVTGAADPISEGDAIRQAMLEQRLAAQRRNESLRSGDAASAPPALSAEEHDRLLRAVYRDANLPDKPRNAIGLAKDIPVPEMEALLKKEMRLSEDIAHQLALQRGLAVRDALVAKGLASERMFLAAPKLRVAGEGDAAWTPRAELSLAVK